MKQYFSELYTGGKSLVEGLGVTMKALFSTYCYSAVPQGRNRYHA